MSIYISKNKLIVSRKVLCLFTHILFSSKSKSSFNMTNKIVTFKNTFQFPWFILCFEVENFCEAVCSCGEDKDICFG